MIHSQIKHYYFSHERSKCILNDNHIFEVNVRRWWQNLHFWIFEQKKNKTKKNFNICLQNKVI